MSDKQNQTPTEDEVLDLLYDMQTDSRPPADLDRRILQAAHQAVETESQIKPREAAQWHVPLAFAAVLVLSIGIVSTLQREEPELLTNAPEMTQMQEAPARSQDMVPDHKPAAKAISKPRRVVVPEEPPAESRLKKEGKQLRSRQAEKAPPTSMADQTMALPEVSVSTPSAPAQTEQLQPKKVLRTPAMKAPADSMADAAGDKLKLGANRMQAQSTTQGQISIASKTEAFAESTTMEEAEMAPATAIAASPAGIPIRLRAIQKALEGDDKTEAEKLFRTFRLQYPDYPLAKLKKELGEDFVNPLVLKPAPAPKK